MVAVVYCSRSSNSRYVYFIKDVSFVRLDDEQNLRIEADGINVRLKSQFNDP